jgi:hypothetical protein
MRILLLFIIPLFFLSCSKDEQLVEKKYENPKHIFNNTSGWYVSKYTENTLDSTKLFNKFWVSFNEDETCAERIKFIQPLIEVWGIWEITQYPQMTGIYIYLPDKNGLRNLEGEWFFNSLDVNKIHLFRTNFYGEDQELILIR